MDGFVGNHLAFFFFFFLLCVCVWVSWFRNHIFRFVGFFDNDLRFYGCMDGFVFLMMHGLYCSLLFLGSHFCDVTLASSNY